MTLPTIHLNGTAAEDLLKQVLDVRAAVNDAINKLSEARPNGRDYYPQGDKALTAAINEHNARRAALDKIAQDMLGMAMHIQEVGNL